MRPRHNMIDEPLPTPDGMDAEAKPTDRDKPPNCDEPHRDEPPPDPSDGDAARECDRRCDREPDVEAEESGDSDTHEHRLERLRLWRTIVTLAVVVARLIRSL